MTFRPVSSGLSSRRSTKTAESGLTRCWWWKGFVGRHHFYHLSPICVSVSGRLAGSLDLLGTGLGSCEPLPSNGEQRRHKTHMPHFCFRASPTPPSPQTAAVDPQRLITAPPKITPHPVKKRRKGDARREKKTGRHNKNSVIRAISMGSPVPPARGRA